MSELFGKWHSLGLEQPADGAALPIYLQVRTRRQRFLGLRCLLLLGHKLTSPDGNIRERYSELVR
jgi:hypothetical protein